jgi:hypothetical protein
MGTEINTPHRPYMRICHSTHHKVHASYACIQDHATLGIYPCLGSQQKYICQTRQEISTYPCEPLPTGSAHEEGHISKTM